MSHEATIAAYPLQWPSGKPRTARPQRSRFDVTFAAALAGLLKEIRQLGGRATVVSTNRRLRLDGLPYAKDREPDDRGVAVYFAYRDRPLCFACDRWDRTGDNVQAIRKTIEAIRGIARWGSGDMVERAFEGFAALPAPKARPPWVVLGIGPYQVHDESAIDAAYREGVKRAHPDRGGSAEALRELTEARDSLRRSIERANRGG